MFLEVTERHPDILQRILSTLLNVVMFEDCKNQWSMSRPLFVLILLYEDYFRWLAKKKIMKMEPIMVINDSCTLQTTTWQHHPVAAVGQAATNDGTVRDADGGSWAKFVDSKPRQVSERSEKVARNRGWLMNTFRFTQNLSLFRREINDSLKTANVNMNDMIVS